MTSCIRCHQDVAMPARFCPNCGAPLSTGGERREERKIVTVLFADLVDFTARAERMDVEDVRSLIVPYHAMLREQLERRGGVVEKFIGDAVMAVFGAPVAHEDDPERAVRAGLAITRATAAANERQPELDLHVRVGVNTGEALVWLDARPELGEGIAAGDVVNTAARLQAAAQTDAVVVGDGTYRATRDAIDYVQMSPVQGKGKSAPMECWRALRPRSRVGERRAREDATPLVDRVRERAELVDAFEHSRRERCVQGLTLVGVPGIGKSRLVWELAEYIAPLPEIIRWRHGRSLPYGPGGTFRALVEIVKAEAGLLESDDTSTALERLRRAIPTITGDGNESIWLEHHLRALVGIEGQETALFGDRRAEAFAAWRRYVELLAERRPTVLIFEDLHWADDALLDFIEHLITWAADVPLLILSTARPELLDRRPGWAADVPHSRVLPLGSLSEQETSELLDVLLSHRQVPSETRAALLANAEGNPLYAQEFLRMLIDQKILVQAQGSWELDTTRDLPVPDSVLGIIAARLDALSPEDKSVAQDAAVVGRVIWTGAVARVADRGAWAIDEALRRLAQRHVLRQRRDSTVAGENEYVFEHALIRDVAYRSVVRSRRAQTHQRAAEWLVSLPGDRRDRADAIAHHYVSALENAEASGGETAALRTATSDALEEAAERARALNSHQMAARLYLQALDLSPEGGPRRPGLLLSYGKALALADEPADHVLGQAAHALVAAGDCSGAAEAESTLGWLLSVAGMPEQARMRDARALELAEGTPPSERFALIKIRAAGHMIFLGDRRDEILKLLQDALAMAGRLGRREMEAEALQFVGLAEVDGGEATGVKHIERALAIANELNSPVCLSCYGNLAEIHRYRGDLAGSAVLHADALRAAERFGIPVQVRRFRAEQGADMYYEGLWDQAVSLIDQYLNAIHAGSPHRLEAEARVLRGRIRLARGEIDRAWDDANAALEFARRTEESFNLFPALAFRARVSTARGTTEAHADVTEFMHLLGAGQPFWATWALPDLLDVLEAMGRLGALPAAIERATPDSRWYAATLAVCEGDHGSAADVYAEIGSRPAEAASRLRAAEAAFREGDRERGQKQLGRARAFFQTVSAHTYLRAAEALGA